MPMSFRTKKIVVAQNSAKFIMFGFDSLQFKYSFSFLSSPLDRLVGLSKLKIMMMSEVVKLQGKIESTWIIGLIISNIVEHHHMLKTMLI